MATVLLNRRILTITEIRTWNGCNPILIPVSPGTADVGNVY